MRFLTEIFVSLAILIQSSVVFSWDHPKFANRGQFPHQVSLELTLSPEINNYHCCGGSIIAELWVLTSAFCVTNIHIPGLAVKIGRYNISVDDEYVQSIQIDKIIVHPKYTGRWALENLAPNDLALLKLESPIIFNSQVQPIQLPEKSGWLGGNYKLNYNLVLSGWGAIANGIFDNHPKVLLTVQLPVVSNKVCLNSIKVHYPHFELDENQMCTRPMDGSLAACIGDYGGPLIQYDKHNLPVLVGVYAWTTMPCNTNGFPPIYTRIPAFVKWITKTMKTT